MGITNKLFVILSIFSSLSSVKQYKESLTSLLELRILSIEAVGTPEEAPFLGWLGGDAAFKGAEGYLSPAKFSLSVASAELEAS